MRVGIIDLGTNTFNLLVADTSAEGFQVVHAEKDGVALGMGGINANRLAVDAIERALVTILRFQETCQKLKVDYIRAFGTSALRGAVNASELLDAIYAGTGIQVEVISGLEEAEMIYQGVQWSYDFAHPGVIMDIGGGSTEFIWADKDGMKKAVSLDIGVSRMYQHLKLSDPFTQEDIAHIRQWLENQSQGALDEWTCPLLIGASGTFETFYELANGRAFPETQKSVGMRKEALQSTLHTIMTSTLAEREQNPFIIPIRQKMAPIAAVKIQWVMEKLGTEAILISPCSLKEGALRR